ncbi:conserved Plasmodium protein, unknown function [Plasmodium gallinaceum]|uniref:Uncharacterized protein n=1 Tax=Plasmodium gallinaceum TaxID=5849 RepID=A0A1J1GNI0_PLAGA|nr:conserved Plasmodium protein, unknown function [Plasmodium gallinaceum]CRG94031.1 conserved Plasmodium protein, unknown function [Plasmodium gallinaceum]
MKNNLSYSVFLFYFFIICYNKISSINVENDYISDLVKLGIFYRNTSTIKKEVYEKINQAHNTFSSCRTCIKLIQLLNKIIKKKKEKYIDIAIEETLELNLCSSELWKEYFNYDEILYNEYILEYCENTFKIIKDNIEENVYELHKNVELFYEKVCGNIDQICKTAIKEEKLNYENQMKTKFIFQLYSKYLIEEENFSYTDDGLPYKLIETNNNNLKLKKSNFAIIQSEIKIIHKNILYNDFKDNHFRLIKIDKLEDKVQNLFLKMKELDMFIFLLYNEFSNEGIIPNDSILEIKIKIQKIIYDIDEVATKNFKNNLIIDEKFLLNKHSFKL